MLKLEFKTDSFNSTRLNAISDTADQLVYDMLSFPAQMHVKLSENYPNFPDEWLIKASHDTGHSKRVIPVFLPPPLFYEGFTFSADALLLLEYYSISSEKWESPYIK